MVLSAEVPSFVKRVSKKGARVTRRPLLVAAPVGGETIAFHVEDNRYVVNHTIIL